MALLLLPASKAHAYLDAGTGSMFVQLLLGGVAGLGVLAKLYWRRVTAFFGFTSVDRKAEPEADADDPRE